MPPDAPSPAAHRDIPIERLSIDTIRTLAMDAVQKANSGHPGTPMALAPVAYALWQRVLRYDPANPLWPNRDRFVLSNGHASMLLYAVLHLTGVKAAGKDGAPGKEPAVSLEDIKRFRQFGSRTPGHPEYRHTTGIETTTGPLGQGCGNSVGMAMASRWLGQQFNHPDGTLFDYNVYAFCSDGDMMEGVSNEAASLAGHLSLGNLCWIYDNNTITIEGHTSLAFGDDVAARFLAYGWNVEHVGDANDIDRLTAALEKFCASRTVPTLIIVDSHIGYGAPHKQDTASAHGEPLGEEEVRLAKRHYGWPEDAHFLVPDGVREHFRDGVGARGQALSQAWEKVFKSFRDKHPEQAALWDTMQKGALPDGWEAKLPQFPADKKGMASREASGQVLNAIAPVFPWLIGGAADLAPSTKTLVKGGGDFENETAGRNLHFGIREHAMGAVLNGLAVCGLRPYGATFLIFSDYMKPPIRLAALMQLPTIYVFTHDSIGLGEDGPTHQPVEQLTQLRATPGIVTLRPADANEVTQAWRAILKQTRPAALVLSRQALPTFDRAGMGAADGVARGAYILQEAKDKTPDVILIATGSEVSLCVEAAALLSQAGVRARIVSMPSWELFEDQDEAYRHHVLPPGLAARVSVEAASTIGWDRYAGPEGAKLGMTHFGASAPYKELYKAFGFTPDNIAALAKAQIAKHKERIREPSEIPA
jgi:transketolase